MGKKEKEETCGAIAMAVAEKKKKKKKKKSLRRSFLIAMAKKEKKRRGASCVWFAHKKKRKTASSSSSTSTSTSTSERRTIPRFYGELEDMKKLSSNNEAFCLSWHTIRDVVNFIRDRHTPTSETYWRWDEYAVSFYLKMCTCFGVDYQHLEAATPPPKQEKPPTQPSEESLKQENRTESAQPSTKEMSEEERHLKEISQPTNSYLWLVEGPFKFGYYSCGTRPDRIPYRLYMLVKEAVDIMNTTNDLIDLEIVERKIHFFCHYLNSHLPTGWKYRRNKASSLLDRGYETPQFSKGLYVPIKDLAKADALDSTLGLLTLRDMADIMSIIHSRKTPSFWNLYPVDIMFYCKLCSCFGIDYHRLEAASEDDVCLMNVGY